ncbi:RadC-like JAB domain protein [Megasphaera vaginalis (ex Srinivasan et al. 2021)]|uniref:RadC-like JAB domain protein n=1 Tax=Megasphaera vaginalis (ex Srinivasan et al. 2021) TaxID=1111454 RepID=U7UQL3_9FIRM|nr:RadC-like JAB domain protein [Megasphaera vaginalis (ex Srinivasan et al. 2021)]
MSTKNKLIAVRTITVGTLNASLAKGRDVFRYALQYNAAAIVLLHNHPSGDPAPSQDDIRVTRQIADAGRVMEIPVLDHIIIGDGIYTSLCEQGYL